MVKRQRISDVIKNLNRLLRKHGNLEVVYASDDEGNRFNPVICDPSIGMYNYQQCDYLSVDEYEELRDNDELWYPDESEKVVCIN